MDKISAVNGAIAATVWQSVHDLVLEIKGDLVWKSTHDIIWCPVFDSISAVQDVANKQCWRIFECAE